MRGMPAAGKEAARAARGLFLGGLLGVVLRLVARRRRS